MEITVVTYFKKINNNVCFNNAIEYNIRKNFIISKYSSLEFIIVICCNKKFNFQTIYNYIYTFKLYTFYSVPCKREGTKCYIAFF